MLKKTITFVDFSGKQRTEDHYFHMDEANAIALGVEADLERVSRATNGKDVMDVFNRLMELSYGVRSQDGTRFIKNAQFFEEFKSTGAYNALFLELVTEADSAAEFVNGILAKPNEGAHRATPSPQQTMQTARERSEAQMQGHLQKTPTVVNETPEPGTGRNQFENNSTLATPAEDAAERAEFEAWKRAHGK